MSELRALAEYMRLFRRNEEHITNKEFKELIYVLEEEEDNSLNYKRIVKKTTLLNQNFYLKLDTFQNIENIVFVNKINETDYDFYIKDLHQNSYLMLPNNNWEIINLIPQSWKIVDINLNMTYYDYASKLVVMESLDEVIVFSDVFLYEPIEDKVFKNYHSGEQYSFDYSDVPGYAGFSNDMLPIPSLYNFFKKNKERRSAEIYKNEKTGKVHLIPRIPNAAKDYLIYPYKEIGVPFHSVTKKFDEPAISLSFNQHNSLLTYLNFSIIKYAEDLDFFNTTEREYFLEEYTRYIYNLTQDRNPLIALSVYMYIPTFIYQKLDVNFLWDTLLKILSKSVTQMYLPMEEIVINLIKGIAINYKNGRENIFLNELLHKKVDDKTLLERLIYRLDGNNFKTLVNYIWSLWKNSSFANIDPEKNNLISEKSPVILDYRSDKTMGFYHDNAKIDWNEKTKHIDVKVTVGTGIFETYKTRDGHGGTIEKTKEIKETFEYSYHPFAPIVIFSADNPKFILKENEDEGEPYQYLPAFILYANKNSAFWANWLKAGEYAIDVVTTLSGVGNILKFGRLYKVLQAGKNLAGSTRTFTKVVTGIKGTAGVAEITSGSVNILLKLTGIADTDLGREISKYLFYFEIAALSGEISLALYKKIKASAGKILAKEEVLRNAAKNGEEAKEIELFIWEIRKILKETGDYSARFATKVSKNLDEVSSKIKTFESKIQKLDYEEGMLLNNAKKIEIKNVTQKLENSISWRHIPDEKFIKSVITHNHPSGSGLSLADVKMFIGTRLNEIRAVTPEGNIYSMKNKGISETLSEELIKKIKTHEDFANATLPNAPEYIDAFVFRLIWEDIKDLVEYVHYIN